MSDSTAVTAATRRAPLDRYLVVTLVATPANLLLYAGVLAATSLRPTVANLLVATVVAVPSFLACKRWVWADRTDVSVRGEVLPYWLSTIVNVLLATFAVQLIASAEPPRWLLAAVPTAVYTVTWLVRFLLLDRYVFVDAAPSAPTGSASGLGTGAGESAAAGAADGGRVVPGRPGSEELGRAATSR